MQGQAQVRWDLDQAKRLSWLLWTMLGEVWAAYVGAGQRGVCRGHRMQCTILLGVGWVRGLWGLGSQAQNTGLISRVPDCEAPKTTRGCLSGCHRAG